ncbi:MAG: DUF3307 domain-containing protein [Bacteroidota bacterium]
MTALFARLLIAHLVGDFIFFRNKRLKEKGKKLWKSRTLVIHSFIHFILALIAFWDITNIGYWVLALGIGASHYVSELILRKWLLRRPQIAFVADQLFHLLLFVCDFWRQLCATNDIVGNRSRTFDCNIPLRKIHRSILVPMATREIS